MLIEMILIMNIHLKLDLQKDGKSEDLIYNEKCVIQDYYYIFVLGLEDSTIIH